MAGLPEFELKRPVALDDALELLATEPGARLLAGGTDLLANLRRGIGRPALLIDLGALPRFTEITHAEDGSTLGAGATLERLAGDTSIVQRYPAIAQAAAAVAGPGQRTVATLGGNLCLDTRCLYYNQSEWWRAANGYCLKLGGDVCHVAPQGQRCLAAFSGDLAPALLVLQAEVELASRRGRRRIPLAELYRDDGAAPLTLARDELLLNLHLPAAAEGLRCGYEKARVRAAMDFPLAGVAAALVLRGGSISQLQIALTGTNSKPFLLSGAEALLGQPPDQDWLNRLAKLVQKQVRPMRTSATASNYRRQVASALAQRLVRGLVGACAPLESAK